MIIDLRSDTFTRPTPEMLEFMFSAEVGDDVFGEDPTVNLLENKVAAYFGMEAALFCASGTMANQIAIKCHTQPGDEIICEENSHVYIYEGGGIAFNSGCQVKAIKGDRGRINNEQILACINPDDIHKARTALVCLENTSNRGGGSCYETSDIDKIAETCKMYNIGLHLDGARLWNAIEVKKQSPLYFGERFHSISICFSKGLGTPVGSVLIGSNDFIRKARRVRKVLGGGMRQAGYLAAACLFALENNIARLSVDHENAKLLEDALLKLPYVKDVSPVDTNLIFFELTPNLKPIDLVNKLQQHGIKAMAISPTQVRMVTHLHITKQDVHQVIKVINELQTF
jgi:threonine aldolase